MNIYEKYFIQIIYIFLLIHTVYNSSDQHPPNSANALDSLSTDLNISSGSNIEDSSSLISDTNEKTNIPPYEGGTDSSSSNPDPSELINEASQTNSLSSSSSETPSDTTSDNLKSDDNIISDKPTQSPNESDSDIPTTTKENQKTDSITSSIIQPATITEETQKEKTYYGGKENKYDNSDKCYQIEPTKGIIEDCTEGAILQNETCCYMTIKYKYNTFHACIPVIKDIKIINERIKILKDIYTGNKSIKINCYKSFVKMSLISIILIFFYY